MAPFVWLSAFSGVAVVAAWAATGVMIAVLSRLQVLDRPNQRSSHVRPTPTGGGVAPVAVLLLGWWAAQSVLPAMWGTVRVGPVLAAAAALTALSLLDDVRGGLFWALRLGAQALAVVVGIATLPGLVFQGLLPSWLDALAAGLVWLWFVNLFNFMDGIDGIAGGETASIGIGVAAVAMLAGMAPVHALQGMTAAAAALGFLMWNWRPAKVFLGDAGSVPLGYLLGWLLLILAAHGAWMAALLLPLYFLADATLTLIRRLAQGQRPWQAHRSHAYQRAAVAFADHATVVVRVLALNVGLIALAIVTAAVPSAGWAALAAGAGLTAALLWYFERAAALRAATG